MMTMMTNNDYQFQHHHRQSSKHHHQSSSKHLNVCVRHALAGRVRLAARAIVLYYSVLNQVCAVAVGHTMAAPRGIVVSRRTLACIP